MISTYRLKSYIAPNIEDKLIRYELDDNVIAFFYNAKRVYEKLRHVALLTIPIEFKSIFISNAKLRMYLDLIETDSQSNIIFGKTSICIPCSLGPGIIDNLVSGHKSAIYCKMSVMHCLINNRYPLLIDDSQYDVIKYKCNECVSIYKFCTNEVLIPVSEINNSDKLEYLTKIITSDISQWHINRDNISESDLKLLSYLIAILYNIEEKLLDKLKSVVLLDDFLKDIKDNPNNDFINIAFSLFRSVAFPSISASNRHQLSIDCHLNNPSKLSGYDLYRVDVMPPNRSGNASSGCERLLFTIKNNKYYFIYYTSTHDFVTKTIQQRLSNILES